MNPEDNDRQEICEEGCCNDQPLEPEPSSNWDAARLFLGAAIILSLLPVLLDLSVPVEVIAGLAAIGWVMLLVEARAYDNMALPLVGLAVSGLVALVSGGSPWLTVPMAAASAWEVYALWNERRLRAECAENGCVECGLYVTEPDPPRER